MKKEIRISFVVCGLAVMSTLVGCSQPAPTPTPDPNAAKPTVRSNDPRVMNDPNIPDDLKRQIGRSSAPKK